MKQSVGNSRKAGLSVLNHQPKVVGDYGVTEGGTCPHLITGAKLTTCHRVNKQVIFLQVQIIVP